MGPAPAHASYDEVADWYADIRRARSETVVDLAVGVWALLSPAHARSFVQNAVLLRRDPGGEALVRWADEVLGGAGLEHRHVVAQAPLSDETLADLTAAGYAPEPEVVMSRPSSLGPLPRPEGVVVEQVDPADAVDFEARMWREEYVPGIGDDELADLLSRRSALDVAGPYLTFVVRDGGTIVAVADMAVRGDAAEIDGVATWPEHRGRGYGDALVSRCVDEAIARGLAHLHLEALTEDWPRHWYARRGWAELGPFTSATRRPTA